MTGRGPSTQGESSEPRAQRQEEEKPGTEVDAGEAAERLNKKPWWKGVRRKPPRQSAQQTSQEADARTSTQSEAGVDPAQALENLINAVEAGTIGTKKPWRKRAQTIKAKVTSWSDRLSFSDSSRPSSKAEILTEPEGEADVLPRLLPLARRRRNQPRSVKNFRHWMMFVGTGDDIWLLDDTPPSKSSPRFRSPRFFRRSPKLGRGSPKFAGKSPKLGERSELVPVIERGKGDDGNPNAPVDAWRRRLD